MADEERFSARRRPQVQPARRLGLRRLPSSHSPAAQNIVLHLGGLWAREHCHLDSDPNEQRHDPADGTVGLPAGPGAGLPGGQDGLGRLLRQAGARPGADRLTGRWAILSDSRILTPAFDVISFNDRYHILVFEAVYDRDSEDLHARAQPGRAPAEG